MIYAPLGLTMVSSMAGPRGSSANTYKVHVEGLPTIMVDLAFSAPESPERVIVAMPGGQGRQYWSDQCPSKYTASSLPPGVVFVDMRWHSCWFDPSPDQNAGPDGMAARVAAVVQFIGAIFPSLPISIIGASAGATAAVSYAAFYDPEHTIRDLVLCGGPLVGITDMCMARDWLKLGSFFVDRSFGGGNKCRARDRRMIPLWDAADVALSVGIDFEQTNVTHIRGANDQFFFTGGDRVDAWLAGRGTSVILEGVGHVVQKTDTGVRAIQSVICW